MTKFLPAAEFAESLGRSVRSIYDARYRGSDLPSAITIGGRLYFAQDDYDNWISEKRRDARSKSDGRQRAIERATGSAKARGSTRPQTRRNPDHFGGNRGPSLNTPSLKDMSNE